MKKYMLRKVSFIMMQESNRGCWKKCVRKLNRAGIHCQVWYRERGWETEGEQHWKSGETLLVITDDEQTAAECAMRKIACIGYQAPEAAVYFPQVKLVLENLDEAEPEGLERFWCRFHGREVWIAETKRLLIRESMPEDFELLYEMEHGRIQDSAYRAEQEKFLAYIGTVYDFYGYGYWTVLKKSVSRKGTDGYGEEFCGRIIGRCGLKDVESGRNEENCVCMVLTKRKWTLEGRTTGNDLAKDEWERYMVNQSDESGWNSHREQAEPVFELELGYLVGALYRRQGYAEEMCREVIGCAFEMFGADQVRVRIHRENEPSLKLARKLGFTVFDMQPAKTAHCRN